MVAFRVAKVWLGEGASVEMLGRPAAVGRTVLETAEAVEVPMAFTA